MGQAAERGLYMIEIIREESFDSEQEKRELPKNIRQIGSPDIGDRIYIENKVHEYMHPYDALQEKTVYVLLGRFENMIGRQCVFVEAAICLEEIAKHKLDMKLVEAEYTFDNNKLLFYFTADGRIDFRELVKDLAAVFRTRIELRQIGVRDETKIMGGYGICGRELCCHTFLSEFAPVSIKMAKEQNLSLNPTKISGVCGRLMCCLKNEEETYEYLNSRLPNVGDYVTTDDGLKGEVSSVNVLRQLVKVLVEVNDEKELREYQADQLKFKPKRRRDVKLTAEEMKELAALEDRGGKSKIDDTK